MKTQLMQDIQESASAPVPPLRQPAARHRPHDAAVAPGGAAPEGRDPPQASAPAGDPAASAPEPPSAPPPTDIPLQADTALPDWLVQRLREDGEEADRHARRNRLQRRVAAWSGGVGAVAVLAAAGLWLHDESRVDGALGLVANTTPAVTMQAAVVPVPADPPADPPADSPADSPAGTRAPNAAAAVGIPGATGGAVSAEAAGALPATVPDPPPAARPQAQAKRVAAKPSPSAPASAQDAGAARRREETLMQCRAHGYDALRCARHACTMTRFGFACRG